MRNTKKGGCAGCNEPGAVQEKDFDDDDKPVWVCRLCGHVHPRKMYNTKRAVADRKRAAELKELMGRILAGEYSIDE